MKSMISCYLYYSTHFKLTPHSEIPKYYDINLNCPAFRFAEPEERVSDFSAYPTPTSEQFSIILDKRWDHADVSIFDVKVRSMWNNRSVRSGSSHRLSAKMLSGTYYVQNRELQLPAF